MKVTTTNEKVTERQKQFDHHQEDLKKMQINLQKLEKDRELAQNNVLIWNEQFKSAEININRLSNELISNQEKKTSLLDKIAEYKTLFDFTFLVKKATRKIPSIFP